MSVNKTTPKARAFSAARLASLANVRQSAFASTVSRSAMLAALLAACGKAPVVALYNGAKLELQVGFMAGALARKGDNRQPEALMSHCRERITLYQGHGGTGKLRAGMKGRRTKVEEDAYLSARVQSSSAFKDAGVAVAEKRGGDSSKTRQPRPSAAKKVAANSNKPVIQRFKSAGEVVAYGQLQAAALLATINRNQTTPVAMKSAVQDFHAAMKAIKA